MHALDTSAIDSHRDFVKFLQQLQNDYLKNGKDWENQNLGDFLGALSAYAADMPGHCDNTLMELNTDTARWRIFADILRGATVYE